MSARHSLTMPVAALISGSSDGHAGARPSTGASTAAIHPGSTSSAANQSGGGAPGVAPAPLRLAVLAPTEGTQAADGTEVMQAAQKAVAEANASGGVFGTRVQLDIVPAEDAAAVSALAGHVTAVAGGFDSAPPAALPWILPADPWAAGREVVATELSAEAAGARLGLDLVQRAVTGTVGIVLGTGPDAALATGLQAEVPTTTVVASSGTCVPAIAALEQQDVEAVAIAGSPQLTSSCIAALEAAAWMPPGGVLVPPSSAYAGVASAGVGTGSGVFTVLGMPWPESTSPGAARFRADLPGITSYRALVTYAAVELAVDVARTTGGLSLSGMAGHSWRNDLYDFTGTANADVQVVEESAGGWVNAP